MTSRISSGSSRVESAVEPTRSTNMTVSWRRSAWDDPVGARQGAASSLIPTGGGGGPTRARTAFSSTLRGPSGSPSSRRSASVSSGRASGVISASRNAAA